MIPKEVINNEKKKVLLIYIYTLTPQNINSIIIGVNFKKRDMPIL